MSFSEISKSYRSTIGSWTLESGTPTECTGPPVHQKITWTMFEPDVAPQLTKKNAVFFNQNIMLCRTVLYGYWSIKTVSVLHVLD